MSELTTILKKKVNKKRNLSMCFQSEMVNNFDEVKNTENLIVNNISPDNNKIIDVNKNINFDDIVDPLSLSPDKNKLMHMSTIVSTNKFISPLLTSKNDSKNDIKFSVKSDKIFLKESSLTINDKSKFITGSLPHTGSLLPLSQKNSRHLSIFSNNSKKINRRKNKSLSYSKTFLKNKLMINNNYGNKSSCSVSSFNSENNNSEHVNNDIFLCSAKFVY